MRNKAGLLYKKNANWNPPVDLRNELDRFVECIGTEDGTPIMKRLLADIGRNSLLFFLGIFPKKCIIELCGGGGTADTHASGACAPSGVRVQIPFSASWKGGPARYGTGLEIRQVDFIHARVQIPSFPSTTNKTWATKLMSFLLFYSCF